MNYIVLTKIVDEIVENSRRKLKHISVNVVNMFRVRNLARAMF